MERKAENFDSKISEDGRNDVKGDVIGSKTNFTENSFHRGQSVEKKTPPKTKLLASEKSNKGILEKHISDPDIKLHKPKENQS